MFTAAMTGVLVAMLIVLIRALRGPEVQDRILAINLFGTHTVLAIAILGFLLGRPEWLDIAMVYGLINFVTTLAILKFMHFANFGWDDDDEEHS